MSVSKPRRSLLSARIVASLALIAAVVAAAYVFWWVQPVKTMLIPVIIAAVPFLGIDRRRVRGLSYAAALLMTALVFLGGFSVGVLFAPSALLLLAAALVAREPPAAAV